MCPVGVMISNRSCNLRAVGVFTSIWKLGALKNECTNVVSKSQVTIPTWVTRRYRRSMNYAALWKLQLDVAGFTLMCHRFSWDFLSFIPWRAANQEICGPRKCLLLKHTWHVILQWCFREVQIILICAAHSRHPNSTVSGSLRERASSSHRI